MFGNAFGYSRQITGQPTGCFRVSYDGSLQAARALWAFQATGLGESGRVEIISVGSRADEGDQPAERAREFLGAHGIDAVPFVLESFATPAEVTLERVGALSAGLLVMGAYGQPTLREFFVGRHGRSWRKLPSRFSCSINIFNDKDKI